VMVTNAHVVSADDPKAVRPDRAVVTFRALDDATQYRIKRVLWTSPAAELDVTVVELDGRPDDATCCPVAVDRPLLNTDPPARTFVIGHPGGAEKVMLSVRDNKVLDSDRVRLHYRTPTLGGSSGSPVFNKQWELIAVHHAGDERMPHLNGKEGTYPANEGIWFDGIAGALRGEA
jgi:V8-like Glu-specific endopeptidase